MKKKGNQYIRKATVLIVHRGTEYLVSRILYSTEYRWSTSPYDAWGTRKAEYARKMARRTGGELYLFNPISGELREARI